MNNNSINNYFDRLFQSDNLVQSSQLFQLTGLLIFIAAMIRQLTKSAMFMLLGFMLLPLATVGTLRAQHPAPVSMLAEKSLVTPQKTESIFSLKPENILSFNLANQLTDWTQSQISYRSYNDLVANQTSANFSPDSTFIVTNRNGSGAGSLRQAIIDANSNPDASSISFNIVDIIQINGFGSYTINLQSGLPSIDTTMTIDASTQPGFENQPLVELNGAGAGISDGFIINANNCVIKGFVINRFNRHGIFIGGSNNTIAGNYIGTNLAGTAALPVLFSGVFIAGNSNTIGGTTPIDRNVISGNGNQGIGIIASGNNIKGNYIGTNAAGTAILGGGGISISTGASNNMIGGSETGARNIISGNNRSSGVDINTFGGAGATGNIVQGNYIGTNATGTAALPNFFSGVSLSGVSGNIIGGTSVNARNVISGNTVFGITIFNNATNNQVLGNYVGTNAAGTAAVPNNEIGIVIGAAPNNIVGGTALGAGNLVSGNNQGGIVIRGVAASGNQILGNFVGTTAAGTAVLGNQSQGIFIFESPNNVIGGTAPGARNIISGNRFANIGITEPTATGNKVIGNYIGTDVSGLIALVSPGVGVAISNGASNIIGGTTPEARNVISGNGDAGVSIGTNASGTIVQGNYIGTNAAGTAAIPNSSSGININNASSNIIGGTSLESRNVISGNGQHGVQIFGLSATGNVVQGNLIGTDATGTSIIGNTFRGVFIFGSASNNLVGGTSPAARNIISGNNAQGIVIDNLLAPGASGNRIQGNYIGTNITGTAVLRNGGVGIAFGGVSGNFIGGSEPGAGNLVSGNASNGISLSTGIPTILTSSSNNTVQGNIIGLKANGTEPLPNGGQGIGVFGGSNNLIGGATIAARNIISSNSGNGVIISGGNGNAILSNSIYSNALLGISLQNGGNNNQAAPTISSASVNEDNSSLIIGQLASAPNSNYNIQFFSNASCDPSGSGEGQNYIGSTSVTTNSLGNASFSFTNLAPLSQIVTATATDSGNNTSRFSQCRAVSLIPFYRYNNPKRSILDHFYTVDFNEIGCGTNGYMIEGIAGYLTTQRPGSVPLYRYYSSALTDYAYTTTLNEFGSAYVLERIEGYVFTTQQPSTVPLYEYNLFGDYFYTVNPDEITDPNIPRQIAAYIYPPNTPGGLPTPNCPTVDLSITQFNRVLSQNGSIAVAVTIQVGNINALLSDNRIQNIGVEIYNFASGQAEEFIFNKNEFQGNNTLTKIFNSQLISINVNTLVATVYSVDGGFEQNFANNFKVLVQPRNSVNINVKATYLRTNQDPQSVNAIPIDLNALRLVPGDTLELRQLGDYSTYTGCPNCEPPIPPSPETATSMVGVFSSTNRLLPASQLNRVSGAIAIGLYPTITQNTLLGELPTDIPQDFYFSQGNVNAVSVVVPANARYLFVSVNDEFFGDNGDSDNDYAVQITRVNAPTNCVYTLSSSQLTVPTAGLSGQQVSVSTQEGCAWTAVSNAPWIIITSGSSGSGNGAVTINVLANTEIARTGTITIAGQTFTVSQEAATTCPTIPISFGQSINGNLNDASCIVGQRPTDIYTFAGTVGQQIVISLDSISAGGVQPFLQLIAPDGTTVVASNSGTTNARIPSNGFFQLPSTGTYTIYAATSGGFGDYALSLSQQPAITCTYAPSPTSTDVAPDGGINFFFDVLTGVGCPTVSATVGANSEHIQIVSNSGGRVTFSVNSYTGLTDRIGTIIVAGQTHTVRQFGVAPPSNDLFAQAQMLPPEISEPIEGRNFNTTAESGEPPTAGNAPGRSVWYRWTAPDDGLFSFTTSGSNFDTVMAIYTGSSVNALTRIAENDDTTSFDPTSKINFRATAGTVYYIAVDGKNGSSGSIRLSYGPFRRLFRLYLQNFNGFASPITPTSVVARRQDGSGQPIIGNQISLGVYEFDLPEDNALYLVTITGPDGITWQPSVYTINNSAALFNELMESVQGGSSGNGQNQTSNATNTIPRYFRGFIHGISTQADLSTLRVRIASAGSSSSVAPVDCSRVLVSGGPGGTMRVAYECVTQPNTTHEIIPSAPNKAFIITVLSLPVIGIDTGPSSNAPFLITATNSPTFNISGRVLANGQDIGGATIDISSGTMTDRTTSDANGNYVFANLIPGLTYTLRAAQAGFIFQPQTVTLIAPGATLNLTAQSCAYTFAGNGSFGANGGQGGFNVMATTSQGCEWTATTGSEWIRINSGNSVGSARVEFTVLPNNGVARQGTIIVGGQSFAVNQAAGRTGFDFDGDRKADVSVFRPSNGSWYINQSMNGFTSIGFGQAGDKIVPADYDGDGKTDVAVYRDGIWYLQRSQTGFISVSFGLPTDIPQPADFNNDGKAELAVFRPSNGTWYVLNLLTNEFSFEQFGQTGDKPVVADYDGDGRADYAIYRNGDWYIQRSSQGFFGIKFGDTNDKLVPADYDGDGRADVAVFRPSNSTWYLQQSTAGFREISFGATGDIPSPADFDGDGKTDIAVFRPSVGTWFIQQSTAGFSSVQFGQNNDIPVSNAFVP